MTRKIESSEDLTNIMNGISDELLASMRSKMEREMDQAVGDMIQLDIKHQFFFGTSYLMAAVQKEFKRRGVTND